MRKFDCQVYLVYFFHVAFKFLCGSCPYYEYVVNESFPCMFIRSFPINRFAYAGAILVPMAVPCVCR